uniref:Col_cuticle_N domain-containing protein n=1 Tax=Panagrellus redivivus TaxID=6233 RepID=A0A7E4UU24_PANRE
MPEQIFEAVDYIGPVVVAAIFAAVLFLLSFCVINWLCIFRTDDVTAFEKLGARYNVKLGVHSLSEVKRGGYISTYALQQEELVRKNTHSYAHA